MEFWSNESFDCLPRLTNTLLSPILKPSTLWLTNSSWISIQWESDTDLDPKTKLCVVTLANKKKGTPTEALPPNMGFAVQSERKQQSIPSRARCGCALTFETQKNLFESREVMSRFRDSLRSRVLKIDEISNSLPSRSLSQWIISSLKEASLLFSEICQSFKKKKKKQEQKQKRPWFSVHWRGSDLVYWRQMMTNLLRAMFFSFWVL